MHLLLLSLAEEEVCQHLLGSLRFLNCVPILYVYLFLRADHPVLGKKGETHEYKMWKCSCVEFSSLLYSAQSTNATCKMGLMRLARSVSTFRNSIKIIKF